MTVNTQDITSGPYSGNDVTTEFAYDFRIEDKSQITVFETDDLGVVTTLTVDTDYTVAGIGNDAGGTITRVAGALPTNYTWYVRSNYQATQDTDFDSQGGFFPDIHEAALDKLTFLVQQINDQIARSFKLSDSYPGAASAELPTPESLKFVRWNSDASALENTAGTTSVVGSDIPFTPYGNISATNLDDAVKELEDEKEPADATILKDADIGINVQAYDSNIPTEVVSQADAEAGTATDPRTWTAERVKQAVEALSGIATGYINGFRPVRDTTTRIAFNAGTCRDAADTVNITGLFWRKEMSLTWAEGYDSGGMFGGAAIPTNGTVHFFVIVKDSDGSVEYGGDLDVNAANIPAGYTAYRRVFSLTTNGSAEFYDFNATEFGGGGMNIDLAAISADFTDTSPGTAAVTVGLTVPNDIEVFARCRSVLSNTATTEAIFTALTQSDVVPSTQNCDLRVTSAGTQGTINFERLTNTSGQIRARINDGSGLSLYNIGTRGWLDMRTV